MKPTEVLMQEHRVIEQMLDCLEMMADYAKSSNQLDHESALQAIDFFRNFADRCHHGKEENCLFPVLEQKGFSREQGPTGVMLSEHEVGRLHVNGMAVAVDAVLAGSSVGISNFVAHAEEFVRLLREHILKEDQCLFQMADRVLNEEDQSRLLENFAAIEQDNLGPKAHERYLEVAATLAKRYDLPTHVTDSVASAGCCHHR